MPSLVLKKMVMGGFDKGLVDSDIADSIDFMVESVSEYIYIFIKCFFFCEKIVISKTLITSVKFCDHQTKKQIK